MKKIIIDIFCNSVTILVVNFNNKLVFHLNKTAFLWLFFDKKQPNNIMDRFPIKEFLYQTSKLIIEQSQKQKMEQQNETGSKKHFLSAYLRLRTIFLVMILFELWQLVLVVVNRHRLVSGQCQVTGE